MLDANQIWGVDEAIAYMEELAAFKPTWIEEPTARDDVLGFPENRTRLRETRHRSRHRRTGALACHL